MQSILAKIGSTNIKVSILQNGNFLVDSIPINISISQTSSLTYVSFHNVIYEIFVQKITETQYEIWINDNIISVILEDKIAQIISSLQVVNKGYDSELIIQAPMPGLVTKIEVEVGEAVDVGQGLIILEAMKMENEIKSPVKGKVKAIQITSYKSVERNQTLMSIERI